MNNGFTITKGSTEHLNSIMEIEEICFGGESFSKRQMSYLINKAKGIFLVILSADKVVAYISLIARANSSNIRVYSVAVHPFYRGLNLGQTLLDEAIKYTLENHKKSITLEVDTNNKAAIALYAKNGFQTLYKIPFYYHHGDAYKMELHIL